MFQFLDLIEPPSSGGGPGLIAVIVAAFSSLFASIKLLFKKGKKKDK